MHKNIFIFLLPFILCITACNNQKSVSNDTNKDSVSAKKDSVVINNKSDKPLYSSDLELFSNGEIFSYCLLLPLKMYPEYYPKEGQDKGQHFFKPIDKKDKYSEIQVQGFGIDADKYFDAKTFFERDKSELEESGLGIDTAFMEEKAHFYVIKGYLPNKMEQKFLQMVWVQEEEIVLKVNYWQKDETSWNNWLKDIRVRGIKCE